MDECKRASCRRSAAPSSDVHAPTTFLRALRPYQLPLYLVARTHSSPCLCAHPRTPSHARAATLQPTALVPSPHLHLLLIRYADRPSLVLMFAPYRLQEENLELDKEAHALRTRLSSLELERIDLRSINRENERARRRAEARVRFTLSSSPPSR